MKNMKTDAIYTDKLRLSVAEINSIGLATEEDRLYQIDKWAKFLAAANTIFEISPDENIRELCRRRAEYEAFERHQCAEITHLKELNATLTQANADKDTEIARLKELLASMQSK